MSEKFQLKVCWGVFDQCGNWRPNPLIDLTTDQQWKENVKNGYMSKDGKLIYKSGCNPQKGTA